MTSKVSTVLMFVLVSAFVMTSEGKSVTFESEIAIPETAITGKTPCGPDGSMYSNDNYCTKYFVCDHGILAEKQCKNGTVWSQNYFTCVVAGSEHDTCTPQHPVRECSRRTVDFIPHPSGCQWYFDCFNKPPQYPNDPFLPYQRECNYPLLFDIRLKRCVDYGNVVCGTGRKVAVWECDYLANQCHRAHCMPCWVRFPSCIGKNNGQNPAFDSESWTPSYVYCLDNRSIYGKLNCPFHPLTYSYERFDPVDRKCVTQWEVPLENGGYKPSCENKTEGIHIVEETPNVAYVCPSKDLYWCEPSFEEHPDLENCTHFAKF